MFGNKKLREARAEAEKWQKRAREAEYSLRLWVTSDNADMSVDYDDCRNRLHRIIAEEKPTSNATVRRMARIARGEA